MSLHRGRAESTGATGPAPDGQEGTRRPRPSRGRDISAIMGRTRKGHHAKSHVRLRRATHHAHPRLLPVEARPRPGPAGLRWSPGLVAGRKPAGADQPGWAPTPVGSWRSSTTNWPPRWSRVTAPASSRSSPPPRPRRPCCSTWSWPARRSRGPRGWRRPGAVAAENQALGVLADMAGLPPGAGGCFVSGGSAGNLSALMVARDTADPPDGRPGARPSGDRHQRGGPLLGGQGAPGARRRGVDRALRGPPTHRRGPTGRARQPPQGWTTPSAWWPPVGPPTPASSTISPGWARWPGSGHCGSTSTGPTAAPPSWPRPSAAGSTASRWLDSFVVDPHKWLFAPFDCAALVYREPRLAKAVHTQDASYLDVLHTEARASGTRATTPTT